MPTLSCLVAPPCTQVLPTGCRRRSLPWPHPPSRSRSLLHQRGSTPSGSVDLSCLPSPPSNRCGSPSKNTTSAAHPLSTGSASKRLMQNFNSCKSFASVFCDIHTVVLNCIYKIIHSEHRKK